MEIKQPEINWKKEKESLREGIQRNWFRPVAGQHKIKFLSNGEKYTTEFEGKEISKVRFDIEIGGEQFSWGIAIGQTENSLYGQIALIASSKNGTKGETISLIVKGTKKETNYTVLEALPMMKGGKESK